MLLTETLQPELSIRPHLLLRPPVPPSTPSSRAWSLLSSIFQSLDALYIVKEMPSIFFFFFLTAFINKIGVKAFSKCQLLSCFINKFRICLKISEEFLQTGFDSRQCTHKGALKVTAYQSHTCLLIFHVFLLPPPPPLILSHVHSWACRLPILSDTMTLLPLIFFFFFLCMCALLQRDLHLSLHSAHCGVLKPRNFHNAVGLQRVGGMVNTTASRSHQKLFNSYTLIL